VGLGPIKSYGAWWNPPFGFVPNRGNRANFRRPSVDVTSVDISVVILSQGRAQSLSICLASLADQEFDRDRFEVLVGIDGTDIENSMPTVPDGLDAEVITLTGCSPGAARNKLLHEARGRWIVLIKDDVICQKSMLERHAHEHEVLMAKSRSAMIVGSAPWRVRPPDRLFDRVLRHSSMAFSYDRMTTDRADRDWGYRHAWTLNLSVPRELAIEDGGFDEELDAPMYLDLEWARRMWLRRGTPVLYRPRAVVTHDHPMSPRGYLKREFRLGRQAYRFAKHDHECACEVFNCDLIDEKELEHLRWQLLRDHELLERLRKSFENWAAMPCAAIDGPDSRIMLQTLYEQQLPLRRATWRTGILYEAGMITAGDIEEMCMPDLLAAA